ncbi:MAG: NAD(P)-dependent oxidoreductase [Chloroflexi bacterium]|nr:NAD(P)-dependent oxidoreductase [Chloroflexota bacterium]
MILIVGGMGFIGLNTTLRLLEVGEKVVITQHAAHRVPAVLADELGKRVFTERMDVTKPFEVMDVVKRTEAESIITFAAPPARGISPQVDYDIYTRGLQNVLEAARAFGLRRVSLASSASVYAGLPEGPYDEDMNLPIDSRTQIEAFKKAMEIHALNYASRASLDVVALRIGSIYGPLYYSMFNPASRMCHSGLKGEDPDFSDRPNGTIFEDDQQDWTHVGDLARGIAMVHTAKELPNRIYNISAGRATSVKETFEAVRKAIPGAVCSAMKPGRTPNMPANPSLSIARIKADVGYEPAFDIESGIADYVGWLRNNPQ